MIQFITSWWVRDVCYLMWYQPSNTTGIYMMPTSSVNFDLVRNVLTATSTCLVFHVAFFTTPNPPSPKFLPTVSSLLSIFNTISPKIKIYCNLYTSYAHQRIIWGRSIIKPGFFKAAKIISKLGLACMVEMISKSSCRLTLVWSLANVLLMVGELGDLARQFGKKKIFMK